MLSDLSDFPEQWRPVPEYEGLYEASTLGQVRSIDRISSDGKKLRGRLLRQGVCGKKPGHNGYLKVELSRNGRLTLRLVHRLVLCAFVPNPAPELFKQVNHIDFDRHNNRLSNLEWCTCTQNVRWTNANGRKAVWAGEMHPHAKLCAMDVRCIRHLAARGIKVGIIATLFGVASGTINLILSGRNWQSVP